MDPDDDMLTPREVAELFGVRSETIASWSRAGRLSPLRTPGGHRRYRRGDITRILADSVAPDEQMVSDAVRLYEQGWSIRQVADRFDCGYGVMRRILQKHTTLRPRNGRPTVR